MMQHLPTRKNLGFERGVRQNTGKMNQHVRKVHIILHSMYHLLFPYLPRHIVQGDDSPALGFHGHVRLA